MYLLYLKKRNSKEGRKEGTGPQLSQLSWQWCFLTCIIVEISENLRLLLSIKKGKKSEWLPLKKKKAPIKLLSVRFSKTFALFYRNQIPDSITAPSPSRIIGRLIFLWGSSYLLFFCPLKEVPNPDSLLKILNKIETPDPNSLVLSQHYLNIPIHIFLRRLLHQVSSSPSKLNFFSYKQPDCQDGLH